MTDRSAYRRRNAYGFVAILSFLLCSELHCSSLAGDDGVPVDPARLQLIHDALANYYSRIQSLRIVYRMQSWGTNDSPETRKVKESRIQLLYRLDDGSTRSIKTTFAALGGPIQSEVEIYYRSGIQTSLNRANRNAAIDRQAQMSPAESNFFLKAVGIHFWGTRNLKFPDVLQFPEKTRDCGREQIEGHGATLLRIGPGLPESLVKGHPYWQDFWMNVWLMEKPPFLPLRMDLFQRVPRGSTASEYVEAGVLVARVPDSTGAIAEYARMVNETLEFRDVRDEARGTSVPFPWRARSISRATLDMTCEEATINPQIPASSFEVAIPSDFALEDNDRIVRVHVAPPGTAQKSDAVSVDEIGKKARELLARPVTLTEQAPQSGSRAIWIFVGVGCAVITTVLFLVRRQTHGS